MHHYYHVTGGRLLVILERFSREFEKAREATIAFMKEKGAVNAISAGLLRFDGKAPRGWQKSKRVDGYFYPSRSVMGRKIAEEVARIPRRPSGWDLLFSIVGEAQEIDTNELSALGFPMWHVNNHGHYLAIHPRWLAEGVMDATELTASQWLVSRSISYAKL